MKLGSVSFPPLVVVALFGFVAPSAGQGQQAADVDAQTSTLGREAQLQDIELDRAGFVAELLLRWRDGFADGGEEMERFLLQAPVGRLHAASKASDFETFRSVATGGPVATNLLGDVDSDLVFFPVAPCRLFDTRAAGGILVAGVVRSFSVNGNMTSQGGDAGGCGIPIDPSAVVFNLAAVTPTGGGNIRAWAFGDPVPTAAAMNFNTLNTSPALSNMITVPTCNLCGLDISLRADVSNVHAVGDIVGYYWSPNDTALETTIVTVNVASLANLATWSLFANCPAGYSMTGGGFDSTWASIGNNYNVYESGPEANGWRCRGVNNTGVTVINTWCRAVCSRTPGR